MELLKLTALVFFGLLSMKLVNGQDPNICNPMCVGELYNQFCGGAVCVTSVVSEEQMVALCSDTCIDALSGPLLLDCFKSSDPDRTDFEEIQKALVADVESFCEPMAPAPAPDLEMDELTMGPDGPDDQVIAGLEDGI